MRWKKRNRSFTSELGWEKQVPWHIKVSDRTIETIMKQDHDYASEHPVWGKNKSATKRCLVLSKKQLTTEFFLTRVPRVEDESLAKHGFCKSFKIIMTIYIAFKREKKIWLFFRAVNNKWFQFAIVELSCHCFRNESQKQQHADNSFTIFALT